jgi:hypothetical protein
MADGNYVFFYNSWGGKVCILHSSAAVAIVLRWQCRPSPR